MRHTNLQISLPMIQEHATVVKEMRKINLKYVIDEYRA
jgi:hypothetical protein